MPVHGDGGEQDRRCAACDIGFESKLLGPPLAILPMGRLRREPDADDLPVAIRFIREVLLRFLAIRATFLLELDSKRGGAIDDECDTQRVGQLQRLIRLSFVAAVISGIWAIAPDGNRSPTTAMALTNSSTRSRIRIPNSVCRQKCPRRRRSRLRKKPSRASK